MIDQHISNCVSTQTSRNYQEKEQYRFLSSLHQQIFRLTAGRTLSQTHPAIPPTMEKAEGSKAKLAPSSTNSHESDTPPAQPRSMAIPNPFTALHPAVTALVVLIASLFSDVIALSIRTSPAIAKPEEPASAQCDKETATFSSIDPQKTYNRPRFCCPEVQCDRDTTANRPDDNNNNNDHDKFTALQARLAATMQNYLCSVHGSDTSTRVELITDLKDVLECLAKR